MKAKPVVRLEGARGFIFMKAVILAGGLGTRLRKRIDDKPKSMASVSGRPFLEYQIEQLKRYSITEVIFCVGYLEYQIKDFLKNGAEFDVNIKYATEKKLLGTGGALKNAQKYLEDSTFLVLNGDSYLDIDLLDFIRYHKEKEAQGTIALAKVDVSEEYGLVELDKENRIRGFFEKVRGSKDRMIINAGVYLFEPEVLAYIPQQKRISLEREFFPLLLRENVNVFGYLSAGYFIDIGTPQKYDQAQRDFKRMAR